MEFQFSCYQGYICLPGTELKLVASVWAAKETWITALDGPVYLDGRGDVVCVAMLTPNGHQRIDKYYSL